MDNTLQNNNSLRLLAGQTSELTQHWVQSLAECLRLVSRHEPQEQFKNHLEKARLDLQALVGVLDLIDDQVLHAYASHMKSGMQHIFESLSAAAPQPPIADALLSLQNTGTALIGYLTAFQTGETASHLPSPEPNQQLVEPGGNANHLPHLLPDNEVIQAMQDWQEPAAWAALQMHAVQGLQTQANVAQARDLDTLMMQILRTKSITAIGQVKQLLLTKFLTQKQAPQFIYALLLTALLEVLERSSGAVDLVYKRCLLQGLRWLKDETVSPQLVHETCALVHEAWSEVHFSQTQDALPPGHHKFRTAVLERLGSLTSWPKKAVTDSHRLSLIPVDASASTTAQQEPDHTVLNSASLDEMGSSDQIKHIGDLRINIVHYSSFLNEADEWSRQLASSMSEWAVAHDAPQPESALVWAHALATSSVTIGLVDLSHLAQQLEALLLQTKNYPALHAAFKQKLVAITEELRRLLHQFAAGFLKTPDPFILQQVQDCQAMLHQATAWQNQAEHGAAQTMVVSQAT